VGAASDEAMRRLLVLLLATLAIASVAGAPVEAAPDLGAEQWLFDAANEVRADHGLPPVTFRDDIIDVSRWHSERMAGEVRLYHNPEREEAVSARVPDWQRLGENVGWSTSVEGLHWRLMASETHRNVILGDYTQLAIGVTYRDGRYWMTQLFLKAPSR
jgi:uncharacterized protein YkwD